MIPPSSPETPSSDGFSTAFATFMRGFVRLIIVLLLGSLLGLAIFFGLPYLNQQISEPIQRNSTAISELQNSQELLEEEIASWLDTAQDRLLALEINQDTIKEQIDTLSSQVTVLENSNASLAATTAAGAAQLDALATQMAAPDPQSTAVARTLARQGEQINQLEANLEDLQVQVDAQNTGSLTLDSLNRELQVLKAAQLLTRARLALARSDIAAARTEINGARVVLAALLASPGETDASGLQAIVQRLELASRNLDEAPLLAVEDVEIAFRLLFGLAGEEPASIASGTESAPVLSPETSPTGTVTPAATPTATPTPGS
jgi:hypothetical protein